MVSQKRKSKLSFRYKTKPQDSLLYLQILYARKTIFAIVKIKKGQVRIWQKNM